jgi:hypothetical protein
MPPGPTLRREPGVVAVTLSGVWIILAVGIYPLVRSGSRGQKKIPAFPAAGLVFSFFLLTQLGVQVVAAGLALAMTGVVFTMATETRKN